MNAANNEKVLKRFGQHLRALRNARQLSLRQLADEAEVDFSQIHRIEKGETNPSLIMLISLAAGLNIELTDLVSFK